MKKYSSVSKKLISILSVVAIWMGLPALLSFPDVCVNAAMSEGFTDAFNRDTLGTDWTDSGSVSSMVSGKLKITLSADPGWHPSTNKNLLVNGVDTATQYVSVDLRGDQLTWSGQQFAGLWTRFKNKSGYCMFVSAGKLVVRKYVNDNNSISSTAFGTDYKWYDYSYNSTRQYRLAMSVANNADGKAVLRATILDYSTNTLVFDKTFTDTGDPLATGVVGLFCEGANASASFDNFYYSPTGPGKGDYGIDGDFTDSFDREDLGAVWTDSGSVSSMVSGKLKITLPADPGWHPSTNKNVLVNGVDTATQYVSVDLQGDQLTWSGQQFAGLWTRFKNKGGYCMFVSAGKLVVRKYVNDNNSISSTAFGTDYKWYDFTYNSTHQYRLAMSVVNNADGKAVLRATILDHTTNTLVFDKTFTDTGDPLATGAVGLFCEGANASASFDNFYYSPATPRKEDYGNVIDGDFTDSFDRGDLGVAWTDNGSVSSMVSGKLKISLSADPGWHPSTNKNVLVNGLDTATQYVSVDLQGDQLTWSGQQFAGLWTRFKSKSGYCMLVSGGKLVVRKYVNDNSDISSTVFGTDYKWYDFTYNSTRQYRLAMSVANNADGKAVLRATILDHTTNTLVFDKTFTDTGDPLTTGTVGLFCEGANASASFDNFYYSPATPRKEDYGNVIDGDFTDSFDRGDLGIAWTDNGSVSSMVSGRLKITLPVDPGWNPCTNKIILVNGLDTATQYASVDLQGDQLTWSGQQFAGLWTRFKSKSGYCMYVSGGKLVVRKYVNDNSDISSTAFGSDYKWYDFSYSNTHQYRLAMSVTNNADGKAVVHALILDYTVKMLVFDKTFTDTGDPLPTGTVGLFCSGSNASAFFENFYYSPTKPDDLPELDEYDETNNPPKYMLYANGALDWGMCGQYISVESGKTYVFSVYYRAILKSSMTPTVNFMTEGWSWYKSIVTERPQNATQVYDKDTRLMTITFTLPDDAIGAKSGSGNVFVGVSEGRKGEAYFYDFRLYKADDPEQKNMMKNAKFEKGFYDWDLSGYTISDPNCFVSPLKKEVEILPYDKDAIFSDFVDDNDGKWNDTNWADKFQDRTPLQDDKSGSDNTGGDKTNPVKTGEDSLQLVIMAFLLVISLNCVILRVIWKRKLKEQGRKNG